MTIASLAAFNPKKLAALLMNLPDGAIIYGLAATGPKIAMPKAAQPESEVIGQIVHDGDRILIWAGDEYYPIFQLREFDGKPFLSVLVP